MTGVFKKNRKVTKRGRHTKREDDAETQQEEGNLHAKEQMLLPEARSEP